MKTQTHSSGLTIIEVIIVVAVVVVLAMLALPAFTSCCGNPGPMTQALSNAKQLHLATQQMASDGIATGKTNLGWPGDIGGTYSNWVAQLVPAYLSTNDFAKLMSAPGMKLDRGKIPAHEDCALLVYAVGKDSPGETVFLSSANFTNTATGGRPLSPTAKPFGNKGFMVFRKAGDGAILLPKQAGNTNIIGTYAPLSD